LVVAEANVDYILLPGINGTMRSSTTPIPAVDLLIPCQLGPQRIKNHKVSQNQRPFCGILSLPPAGPVSKVTGGLMI